MDTPRPGRFDSKAAAREAVWARLREDRVARFPFPTRGRIPNFAGAERAAARLVEHEPWKSARRIKCNPDSPQRPLRALLLERGVRVYVPTPRLVGGFWLLDPARIPADRLKDAAGMVRGEEFAAPVALDDLPPMDAIVAGSVAVTADGRRCGKGHGYADLEYALALELGHPPAPVATTVHELKVVESFPADDTDLPLALIATPDRTLTIGAPAAPPAGIDWERLPAGALEAMPPLAELARRLGRR